MAAIEPHSRDEHADEAALPAVAAGGLLAGKRLVVTGVLTRRSLAYAVARAAQRHGAEIVLTTFGRGRRLTERTARGLDRPVRVLELDVSEPEQFERLRSAIAEQWGTVDGAVHSIAFAPPDAVGGDFLGTPAESAELAFRVSVWSFKALAASLAPLMRPGGSIVGLDFDASRAWPRYDWMGVAKAALESASRYLAMYLGPRGIRVNLVAPGPLRTLAASALDEFDAFADTWSVRAPLGWDPRDTGIVAGPVCFLLSDLSAGVSGEILHVDGGCNAIGSSEDERL
jgi:meromycolic acid enoyl-[acyl-carrier-protein] reductase